VSSECTRFNSANLCRECEGVCARTVAVCARVHAMHRGSALALQIDKSDNGKLATARSHRLARPFSAPMCRRVRCAELCHRAQRD
jgi:hypothetical protein